MDRGGCQDLGGRLASERKIEPFVVLRWLSTPGVGLPVVTPIRASTIRGPVAW